MTKKVVYSAVYGDGYPFESLAKKVETATYPEDLVEQDSVLVVWGGADINPALYNHPQSKTTWPGGRRDMIEWNLMLRAKELNIPIIGICRGAQMLCALSGGFLIQDTTNHGHGHTITTVEGKTLHVNSLHHQMMAGYEQVGHKLLAWSTENLSNYYVYKDDQKYVPPADWKEPEFIHFTDTKGFAIQWHPEMMGRKEPATQYVMEYIKENM